MNRQIFCLSVVLCFVVVASAQAAVRCPPAASASHTVVKDAKLLDEVRGGLVMSNAGARMTDYRGGRLASEVYGVEGVQSGCVEVIDSDDDYEPFIPTKMYVRMGAGMNIPFATSKAKYGGLPNAAAESDGSWLTQFGVGWNVNPFARVEADVQIHNYRFARAPWSAFDSRAKTQSGGVALYIDMLHRYERHGDVTVRRRFVPFFGIGASAGTIDFEDAGVWPIGFANGERNAFIAPRGVLGVSVALSNTWNLDLAYQYELLVSRGFGWETRGSSAASVSDIIASFRINF